MHYANNYPEMLFNVQELNPTVLNRIGKKRTILVEKLLSGYQLKFPNNIKLIDKCPDEPEYATILEKSLMMGYQKDLKVIDTEIVMSVQNEINLI